MGRNANRLSVIGQGIFASSIKGPEGEGEPAELSTKGEVTWEETSNSLLGEGVRVSLPNSRQPERLRTMAAPDQRRDGVTHYSYGEGEGPQKPPST